MKLFLVSCITALAVVACGSQALAANALGNASFETPILDVTQPGGGSFPFLGDWSAYAPAGVAGFGNSAVMPRTGALSGELWITNQNDTFSVMWQDVPVTPGQMWTYSGYHRAVEDPFLAGIEWRVEWMDADEVEISRTDNFTADLTGDYAQFSSTVEVPDGAVYGRTVYAIVTWGKPPGTSGTVYLDDFSFGEAVTEDADFNDDGDTDGGDFLIWQRGYGTGTNNSTGDADGNGTVNGADLTIWEAHYGSPLVATLAVVPEPTSGWLIVCGSCLLASLWRRQ
jgi:hypothetical protein